MDKLKTGSGKKLRTESLTNTELPVPYDAESMPGASVLGTDGQVYVSLISPGETVPGWSRVISQKEGVPVYIGEGEPSTDITGNASPKFQVEVTSSFPGDFSYAGMALIAHANSVATSSFSICKTRGTQSGDRTLVQQEDRLASYLAQGADGEKFTVVGGIRCFVDGSTNLNQVPGRWDFSTSPFTAGVPNVGGNTAFIIDRMRLNAEGNVLIGNTTGTERLDVTGNIKASNNLLSSGLLVGINQPRGDYRILVDQNPYTPSLQVEGSTISSSSIAVTSVSNEAATPARLILAKSRGTSTLSNQLLVDGDTVGTVLFLGADGSDLFPGASIRVLATGVPALGDLPMNFDIRTREQGSVEVGLISRFRVTSEGKVLIGNTAGTERLSVTGNIQVTDTSNGYKVGSSTVVGSRKIGWAAPSGTATRTTFDTGTVTTEQLAERVKGLIDDLISHGLIGT